MHSRSTGCGVMYFFYDMSVRLEGHFLVSGTCPDDRMAISALDPLICLPWGPTLSELARWMHGIGFSAEYTSMLLTSNIDHCRCVLCRPKL